MLMVRSSMSRGSGRPYGFAPPAATPTGRISSQALLLHRSDQRRQAAPRGSSRGRAAVALVLGPPPRGRATAAFSAASENSASNVSSRLTIPLGTVEERPVVALEA